MAKIVPFRGLRPKQEFVSEVATLPYDVVNVAEAAQFKNRKNHFYHVTRSEIDLPENVDVHSAEVYGKAKENLNDFINRGILTRDEQPCYYIYELVMHGRSQTGLICGSSVDDYLSGVIKKHEFTRPEKELDRINHIKTTGAQTGVVFLAYEDQADMQDLISEWKSSHEPEYDFTAEDGVRHILWVVDDQDKVALVTDIFDKKVPATYIADGHHRAASAAAVCSERRAAQGNSGAGNADYFITCIFPASQLEILDYNRVVKDLNGMNHAQFLEALQAQFEYRISENNQPVRPSAPHEFGLYTGGKWYVLTAKPGTWKNDPIGVLDVSVLQDNILSALLGIHDPRTDKRVDFVGGIRGLKELEKRVDSGEMAAAFSCYPVSIQQLFAIADSGEVMPPKSTWFEPKLRDGLVVYLID